MKPYLWSGVNLQQTCYLTRANGRTLVVYYAFVHLQLIEIIIIHEANMIWR